MTPEEAMPSRANVKLPLCSFEYQRFVAEYEGWKKSATDLPRNAYDATLLWMFSRGGSADQTEQLARDICKQCGISSISFANGAAVDSREGGLGFGVLVDEHWVNQNSGGHLLGRDDDIRSHLESLSLSLVRRRHYLVDGQPGVGKTAFIKRLLCQAAAQWRISHEPALQSTCFIFCTSLDFVGTDDESRAKIEGLYAYLRSHPECVPVFDQFEQMMNPGLGLHSCFMSTFGSILQSAGRPCVFVCETTAASHDSLKSIPRHALRELPAVATREVLKQVLPDFLSSGASSFELSEDQETFVSELISLASSRYPGHYRPRICLDLAEGAVNRATHRHLRNEEPLGCVTLRDLREHVAQERQVSIELLGNDPGVYYARLRDQLRADVIGQDHAIDTICSVLTRQATMPARATPRGRFLFVGPPGVGKTQLGRALALRLGYGEEGFFIVNMSEYSSEGARTRFLGADPGYVGFGSTQTIFDKVRSRPSCVVVLDEIDRSHSSIQDILLGILEGEGKDALGSSVQFSHVIFVMTTNQGQDQVTTAYQREMKELLDECHQVPAAHFVNSPEDKDAEELGALVSRLDEGRYRLIEHLANEDSLRDLMLKGAVDDTQIEMLKFVDNALETCRKTFENEKQTRDDGDVGGSADAIQAYIQLKRTRASLEQVHAKAALDRALLDRIDFIVPFFPIKEPHLLAKILELKLKSFGWAHCPVDVRAEILEDALRQQESIRPLERLIIKRMSEGALSSICN